MKNRRVFLFVLLVGAIFACSILLSSCLSDEEVHTAETQAQSTTEESVELEEGGLKPSEGLEFKLVKNEFFNRNEEWYTVVGIGTFDGKDLVIPSRYKGVQVKSIANRAFAECKNIESVYIPYTVDHIGDEAFLFCENLKQVKLSDSLGIINPFTFAGCSSLTEIVIPDNVRVINECAFAACENLMHITIGKGITQSYNFSDSAFDGCYKIVDIHLRSSAENLLDGFQYRGAYIYKDEAELSEEKFFEKDGYTFYYHKGIDSYLLINYSGGESEITLPEDINGNKYSIFSLAFTQRNDITKIVISGGVSSIGEGAFGGCSNLTSVTICEGVESINGAAFKGCTSLAELDIADGINTISSEAFADCRSLKEVRIPDGVVTVQGKTFSNCTALESVILSQSVEKIDNNAFIGCENITALHFEGDRDSWEQIEIGWDGNRLPIYGVTYGIKNLYYTLSGDGSYYTVNGLGTIEGSAVEIPSTYKDIPVTRIGNSAFSGQFGIESIIIPESVTHIGKNAFENCSSLKEINIPAAVTVINEETFAGCSSLTSIIIPDGVLEIGNSVFKGCSSLESIVIPDGVTTLSYQLFSECTSLKKVTYGNDINTIDSYAFENCTSIVSLTVPNGVESIGYCAFGGCTALKSIELPEGLQTLFAYAFKNCVSLESITLPSTVVEIEDYAFQGSGLKSMIIPDSVEILGKHIFDDCTSIEALTLPLYSGNIGRLFNDSYESEEKIPDSLKTVNITKINTESFSFSNMESIENISLPDDIENIPAYAFSGCLSLKNIKFSDKIKTIGDSAFIDCDSLEEITIPGNVESIFRYAFSDCDNLSSVVIGDGVKMIYDGAFANLAKLTEITVPNSVEGMGFGVFEGCNNIASMTLPFVGSKREVTDPDYGSIGYLFGSSFNDNSENIPESLKKVVITDAVEIVERAFSYCSHIEQISIPSNINAVFSNSFSECSSLVYNEFGNCKYLGNDENPFVALIDTLDNDIESCEIHPDAVIVATSAFYGCENLRNVTVHNGIKNFDSQSLRYCDVIEYNKYGNSLYLGNEDNPYLILVEEENNQESYCYISEDTKFICDSAYDNSSLETVYFGGDEEAWNKIKIDRFADLTVIFNISCNGLKFKLNDDSASYSVAGAIDGIGFVDIPSTYKGLPVTEIGQAAFDGRTDVEGVNIPDGLVTIGNGAFRNCIYISEVVIPDSVTSIGTMAFSGCVNLISVNIGASVEIIGPYAFSDCTSIYGIEIPSSVKSIAMSAFSGCTGLRNLTLNNGLETIGVYAFENCVGLETLTIPDSVYGIAQSAFEGCSNLVKITLPYVGCFRDPSEAESNNQQYFGYIFGYIGDGDDPGYESFPWRLREVVITGGEAIAPVAFYGMRNIESITFSASVKSIGEGAFAGCDGLRKIIYLGTEAEWNAISGLENAGIPEGVVIVFNTEEE